MNEQWQALSLADAVIAVPGMVTGSSADSALFELEGERGQWASSARAFLERRVRFGCQRTAVVLDDDDDPAAVAVLRAVQDHHAQARITENTIAIRARAWAINLLRTLKRQPPWISTLPPYWQDRPAFIVGAGPSLDRNGALLRQAQRRGPVIAVNTAVPAVLGHGVLPDLVVCAESKPLPGHIQALRGMGVPVALDARAAAENWDAAQRAWGYISHDPALVPYALQLGVQPLNSGDSVACHAAALALLLGAHPIVLVGVDLAYAADGQCYASGSPFEDLRAAVDQSGMVSVQGESKRMPDQGALLRPAWGRGHDQVISTYEFESFAMWFSKAARRFMFINATEGGQHISGMTDRTLKRMLVCLRERVPAHLPTPERRSTEPVLQGIAEAAERFLRAPTQAPPADLPLLHLWTVPAVLETSRERDPAVRAKAILEANVQGAREILAEISGC